jgi:UDP-glucose-4-epimerase GalE
MSILITGGAGFIGSHSASLLSKSGYDIVVLDNLSTGRRSNARWGTFVLGDISDVALVRRVLRERGVTAVLHLAGNAHVGESMLRPDAYFSNNVRGSLALLDAMGAEHVSQIVFASSCAVYGNPVSATVREDEAERPLSPYGESKLFIERTLPWYERAFGLRWLALRYFNAAGAEGDLGEEAARSLRVIPLTVHAALGNGYPIQIFGTSYPTHDGTAVRDYVHVTDIARANLSALQFVEHGHPGAVVNIGTGIGVSVRQIIDAVGDETGQPVPFHEHLPRGGDAARVIANTARARELLGWTPTQPELAQIVASAVGSYRAQAAVEAGGLRETVCR